jgi:uncharacterized protein (TIGR03083 family)
VLAPDAYPPLLESLQREFLAAARTADLRAPVPVCGAWVVADLVDHVAEIHHWAAAMARGVRAEPLAPSQDPSSRYDAAAVELREALAELGPDASGRILDGLTPDGRGPVSFWARRQVHETLIHLDDLLAASAGRPAEAAPETWADAVDEAVTVMYVRQVALGRSVPVVPAIALTASDGTAAWRLGDGVPAVTVAGTARELALLLWKRRALRETGLAVHGEPQVLLRALALPLLP